MFDGVNWAGFPYFLPAYPCSLSYCMICLGIGASPSSLIIATLSTELSVLKSLGSPWFLCEDAPLATTSVIGYLPSQHFFFRLYLSPTPPPCIYLLLLLPHSSSSPLLQIPPPSRQSLNNSLQNTLDIKQQNSSGREHIFPVTSAKKLPEHQYDTMTLGPRSVSQFCHI